MGRGPCFIFGLNGNFYCGGNFGFSSINAFVKLKFVDGYSWCLIIFSVLVFPFFFIFSNWWSFLYFPRFLSRFGEYFVIDCVSFYLGLLSIVLRGSLFFVCGRLSIGSIIVVLISVISSILSYMSVKVLIFWVFYEISILSLFYLLIVDSPYSERYIAGWYLLGYVVLTSLPMLLCILFISSEYGSLCMLSWSVSFLDITSSIPLLLVLGVMFITKVPVPPFHVWLPIVHAEARSIVSVCLRGYVMKLGILGVLRLCYFIVSDWLFISGYVLIAFSLSLLFFISAARELDGKRWLAFLRLAHILICIVYFFASDYSSSYFIFLYSFGHGLSAGLLFLFLWWSYDLSGSRNWLVLKSVLGGSRFFRVVLVGSLCRAASLPTRLQFFAEVSLLSKLSIFNLVNFVILCGYLFVGSLIPFFLLGLLCIRHFNIRCSSGTSMLKFLSIIIWLIIWRFLAFLFI